MEFETKEQSEAYLDEHQESNISTLQSVPVLEAENDGNATTIQEKENEFVSLKSLMIEENETVHQIEVEIERLMKIISDDRKLIQEKDLQITKLRDNERTKLFQE